MVSTSNLDSNSSTREQIWMDQIREILAEEEKLDKEIPVSIFRVPKALSALKPEAYAPQLMCMGPYHCFRPELFGMERHKLAAATRFRKTYFNSLAFEQLADELRELEHKVRACYHMYLDINGNSLSWIMAIDGLFLLDFLYSYMYKNEIFSSSLPCTAHLVDSSGKKLAYQQAILRDLMMLENQIPLFVPRKIFSKQYSSSDIDENALNGFLLRFLKLVSPFKLREDLDPLNSRIFHHSHLLDLLYRLIVPSTDDGPPQPEVRIEVVQNPEQIPQKPPKYFSRLWNLSSNLEIPLVRKFTEPIDVVNLVGKQIPGMSGLASSVKERINSECEDKTTPRADEIMIPSVALLCAAGVKFRPSHSGGINRASINFDKKSKKFYLPVITLDVNSETIIRNLVAYEASVSDSLVFTRYTELMNGIIDGVEDAKLLREKNIIVNRLKSDAEVAELFNGMSKSIRLSNVSYIDETIKGLNKYYDSRPNVWLYRSVKTYVYGSWQILTFFAAVSVILLMNLQSFCLVYSCKDIFKSWFGRD